MLKDVLLCVFEIALLDVSIEEIGTNYGRYTVSSTALFSTFITKENFISVMLSIQNTLKGNPLFMATYKKLNHTLNGFYRKQHIAMLHNGRCGSTVLAKMLDQHPKIHWPGEVFEVYMEATASKQEAFVETILAGSTKMRTSEVYGFETKYLPEQQLSEVCINMPLEHYLTTLDKLGFSKFIVLHRQNYLRRAISAEVARQKQTWHSHTDIQTTTKITLDVNKIKIGIQEKSLLESFEHLDHQYQKLQALVKPKEHLLLNYETDILEDPHKAYSKVCAFLGLDNANPNITLKRTNPFALKNLLNNYDEVATTISPTTYSWMLKD